MKVINFDYGYFTLLRRMLVKQIYNYFKEVNGKDLVGDTTTIERMLDSMQKENRVIFLVVNEDETFLYGFAILFVNTQYDMLAPTLCIEYMYIEPEFRSTKAITMLYNTVADTGVINNMNGIGYTYANSANVKNSKRYKGEIIGYITHFDYTLVKEKTEKVKNYLQRKKNEVKK